MILRDRVYIVSGGGRDEWGEYIPPTEEGPYPAVVEPVRSEETQIPGANLVTGYYRLTIGPDPGSRLTYTGQVKWLGRTMSVQGDVEPHTVNGRVHHYEALLRMG